MTILAEIFKVTLDELVSGNLPEKGGAAQYTSETAYDIDVTHTLI